MDKQRVQVLIADGDRSTQGLLKMLLADADDVVVVGETAGEAETLRLIESLRPDVALVDSSLPGPDGIHLVRSIRHRAGFAGIVVLGIYGFDAHEFLDAGADAYVLKDAGRDRFLETIRSVASHLPRGE